jgi:hypothetical protein
MSNLHTYEHLVAFSTPPADVRCWPITADIVLKLDVGFWSVTETQGNAVLPTSAVINPGTSVVLAPDPFQSVRLTRYDALS